MPASQKRLGDLHAALTEELIEAVVPQKEEEVTEDGEGNITKVVRVRRAAPAALAVAAKFLKDNSITADIEGDEKLAELQKKLGKRIPSKRDMEDAMGAIAKGLLN